MFEMIAVVLYLALAIASVLLNTISKRIFLEEDDRRVARRMNGVEEF